MNISTDDILAPQPKLIQDIDDRLHDSLGFKRWISQSYSSSWKIGSDQSRQVCVTIVNDNLAKGCARAGH
jgi:hypothetical protein|tara:strand:- start:680 stop:889 length:210 start_codon:yes stop_codon:yes gene_type:complete